MRRHEERTEQAFGPYKHRRRWRVVIVAANGARRYRSFAPDEETKARDYVSTFVDETSGRTVSAAVDEYEQHLRNRGLAETTIDTVSYRLKGLLQTTARDRKLRLLSVAVARSLFAARCKGAKPGAGIKPDTQRGELAAANGFGEWCVTQGWLRANPFDELVPNGKRARNKPRLRIDEARKLLDVALAEDSIEGIAVAMALLMGMRATEVTNRVVRDVDDGARILWIDRAKTAAGDRTLEIPLVLRARLTALVAGRNGGERLWGDVRRRWLGYHVPRLCKAAKVPEVSPHGLRRTWSSISVKESPVEHVAAALGQTGPGVTRSNYLRQGDEQAGKSRVVLRAIAGGRS